MYIKVYFTNLLLSDHNFLVTTYIINYFYIYGYMEKITTIRVEQETKALIDSFKLCSEESYNSTLKRLLRQKENST